MHHKVNPHGLRVGVVRDWESRWNLDVDLIIEGFNRSLVLSGERVRNLQVTSNFRTYISNSCDVESIVKTMKKR